MFHAYDGMHKFRLKKFFLPVLILAAGLCITIRSEARGIPVSEIYTTLTTYQDTLPLTGRDSLARKGDSLVLRRDTLPGGQRRDTFALRISKDTLDAEVNYEAQDSAVVLVVPKQIILYGQTKTTYRDVLLTAPKVSLDQQSNILTATADRDSLGEIQNRAHFEQAANNFDRIFH